jgi:hypothetical protein
VGAVPNRFSIGVKQQLAVRAANTSTAFVGVHLTFMLRGWGLAVKTDVSFIAKLPIKGFFLSEHKRRPKEKSDKTTMRHLHKSTELFLTASGLNALRVCRFKVFF